jgi:DNA-binding NarL/FixJ family response regulator
MRGIRVEIAGRPLAGGLGPKLMRKLRILLADDHETVREGLKVILNAQPDMEVVAEASDGNTAISQARAVSPDIVVMDVTMPRLNGLQATEALRECCPGVRVLTLTRHADDGYLQQLLRAGASGYVLKQSRSTELLHAIRAVASGGKYLDPAVADRVIGDFGRRNYRVDSPVDTPALSPREEEILRLVAWGYSNKEVAEVLGLSVKTVESHKTNAMHKLGLHNRIDVVKHALLKGWLHDN